MTALEAWIIIPSWDRFQHYADRSPVWIKVYSDLLSDDDWLDLPDSAKGLLLLIWLEYGRSDGLLKSSRVVAGGPQKNRRRALERLNDAGWIELSASRPLALRARSREKRREDPPTPRRAGGSNSQKKGARKTGWRLVRGSHGTSHIPDPDGTDRPPVDAPTLKEMP